MEKNELIQTLVKNEITKSYKTTMLWYIEVFTNYYVDNNKNNDSDSKKEDLDKFSKILNLLKNKVNNISNDKKLLDFLDILEILLPLTISGGEVNFDNLNLFDLDESSKDGEVGFVTQRDNEISTIEINELNLLDNESMKGITFLIIEITTLINKLKFLSNSLFKSMEEKIDFKSEIAKSELVDISDFLKIYDINLFNSQLNDLNWIYKNILKNSAERKKFDIFKKNILESESGFKKYLSIMDLFSFLGSTDKWEKRQESYEHIMELMIPANLDEINKSKDFENDEIIIGHLKELMDEEYKKEQSSFNYVFSIHPSFLFLSILQKDIESFIQKWNKTLN